MRIPRRGLFAATTGLLAVCAGAAAGSSGATPGGVVDRAAAQVERDPVCREVLRFSRPSTFTDDAPSAEMLSTLGVLRRPARTDELLADRLPVFVSAEGVYRRYIRIARSASGRTYALVPARNDTWYEARPARCTTELRRLVTQRLEGRSRAFRRKADRRLNRLIRNRWAPRPPEELEGLYFLAYSAENGFGGGGEAGVAEIRRTGSWGSSSSTAAGEVERSTVSALLPDGVAGIQVTFARTESRGPHRPRRRYAHAIRRTLLVRDNVVSFRVLRDAEDAFPSRQVWRSATGEVLRVVGRLK